MDHLTQKQDKRRGRIAATVYTMLLLLFLFTISFKSPERDTSSEGIVVNLGYMETGSENNTPTALENDVVTPPAPTEETEPIESVPEEDPVITQEVEETVTIEENTETTEVSEPSEVVETNTVQEIEEVEPEPEPEVDPNALFTSNTVSPNEGTTEQSGDAGVADGVLESNIYEGIDADGLSNEGVGWSLAGRSLLHKPTVYDESQKYGAVNVKITVNKEGHVTQAQFTSWKSTTTDDYLVSLALKEAKNYRFNADASAPDVQTGYVRFVFKLQ